MEHALQKGAQRSCRSAVKRRAFHTSRQCLATANENFRAAAPIRFNNDRNQFARSRPRAQFMEEDEDDRPTRRPGRGAQSPSENQLLRRIRIVPASPSYFTALPKHMDDVLHLSALLRRYQLLPVSKPEEVERVTFKKRKDYQIETQEPVRSKSYNMMLVLLKRLNSIHPSLIPEEVTSTLERFKRLVQPYLNKPKPIVIDKYGRARAMGRRKTSKAMVYLVEGEGQCLINGRSLTQYFARLHDRESAIWALKATQRLDKYNVFGLVRGGGTTGQAEALTLAVTKALLAHEPDLKPALRRGECPSHQASMIFTCILTTFQPVLLHAILERSRERSLESSRPARCLPGSSDNIVQNLYTTASTSRRSSVLTIIIIRSSPLALLHSIAWLCTRKPAAWPTCSTADLQLRVCSPRPNPRVCLLKLLFVCDVSTTSNVEVARSNAFSIDLPAIPAVSFLLYTYTIYL